MRSSIIHAARGRRLPRLKRRLQLWLPVLPPSCPARSLEAEHGAEGDLDKQVPRLQVLAGHDATHARLAGLAQRKARLRRQWEAGGGWAGRRTGRRCTKDSRLRRDLQAVIRSLHRPSGSFAAVERGLGGLGATLASPTSRLCSWPKPPAAPQGSCPSLMARQLRQGP